MVSGIGSEHPDAVKPLAAQFVTLFGCTSSIEKSKFRQVVDIESN